VPDKEAGLNLKMVLPPHKAGQRTSVGDVLENTFRLVDERFCFFQVNFPVLERRAIKNIDCPVCIYFEAHLYDTMTLRMIREQC
jgi:hypothetical protein